MAFSNRNLRETNGYATDSAFAHLVHVIFHPMLFRDNIDAFLLLIEQCFAGNPFDDAKELDALHTELRESYAAFISQLRFNILNASTFSPKLQLEELFASLDQFATLMIRDSHILDNLFITKGWEPAGIKYDNPVWSEARYAKANDDEISGRSLSVLQAKLDLGHPIELLFFALTSVESRSIQQGLASAFVKKAWEAVNNSYSLHGGIVREVPREAHRMLIANVPVRQDLQRYVPGIRELSLFEFPTEAHALEEWARYLNDLRWWNHPFSRPWPAPIEYERAFHEAPDRNEFLSALRRLLDVVEPVLLTPDEDNPLFREDNQPLFEVKREEIRRYGLRRARVIAKRMGRWLQLRQKPADGQFLEALERILLVPDWDEQGKPTGKLTVAYCHTEHDAELHFNFLLTRLREQIPQNPITLNAFRRRLEKFLDNPLAKLTRNEFDEGAKFYGFNGVHKILISRFPQFTFVDGITDVDNERVIQFADNFRSKFANTITWRMSWAQNALDIVGPSDNELLGDIAQLELTLNQRQVALICYYKGKKLTRGIVANNVAADNGFKSKTSGQSLYQNYTEINDYNNRVGFDFETKTKGFNMIADMEAIKPFLTFLETKRVDDEILIITSKIV